MEEFTEQEYIQKFVELGHQCWQSKQEGYIVDITTEVDFKGNSKITIIVTK